MDIRLGPGVADLGGLHVIGANRHDSRRIDNQPRGRAGRQGIRLVRFFVSHEDPLMIKYGADDPGSSTRPTASSDGGRPESRHPAVLAERESVVEGKGSPCRSGARPRSRTAARATERLVTLLTIDDLWSDYLAAVAELRAGTVWIRSAAATRWGFPARLHAMFEELQRTIDDEIDARLEAGDAARLDARQRGATWTYLTTDEPFGTMTERAMRGLVRMMRRVVRGSAG